MAGDWIPMRIDLADDPAVIAIAAALGMDEFSVVGRLHKLWGWANKQLASGTAPGVTLDWVDRYVSAPGFASAMLAAGWLRTRSGNVTEFPNFERWNSSGAKRRLLGAQRMRNKRDAVSATPAQPEKRREEKKEKTEDPPKPPAEEPAPIPPGLDAPAFREAWANWLRDKPGSKLRLPAQARQLAKLADIGPEAAVRCIEHSLMNQYQGLFPEKFATPKQPAARGLFDFGAMTESRILAQAAEAFTRKKED